MHARRQGPVVRQHILDTDPGEGATEITATHRSWTQTRKSYQQTEFSKKNQSRRTEESSRLREGTRARRGAGAPSHQWDTGGDGSVPSRGCHRKGGRGSPARSQGHGSQGRRRTARVRCARGPGCSVRAGPRGGRPGRCPGRTGGTTGQPAMRGTPLTAPRQTRRQDHPQMHPSRRLSRLCGASITPHDRP